MYNNDNNNNNQFKDLIETTTKTTIKLRNKKNLKITKNHAKKNEKKS